jgi:hypothetical protein
MTRSISDVWSRIEAHAGEDFKLIGGQVFQEEVPGNYLRHRSRPPSLADQLRESTRSSPPCQHGIGSGPPRPFLCVRNPDGQQNENVNLKWPHRDGLKWPHPGTRCSNSRHVKRSA